MSYPPIPHFPLFFCSLSAYQIDKSQFTTTFKQNLPYNPSNDISHEEAVGGRKP